MQTQAIIDAINAYADAQKRYAGDREWVALTHRSSTGAEADEARRLRDAGRDALDMLQDWPEVEKREDGACVLQAPDGAQVLYYCERLNERTLERVKAL